MDTERSRSNHVPGRVALVTGGATGLGAAFCRVLAAGGARVIVADIKKDQAEQVAQSLGAEAAEVNVAEREQIESLVSSVKERYGSLDIMINNAGVSAGGEPLEIAWEDWQRVIQVNLMGVIAGSLAALRVMKQQGSGHILNMGSMNGLALTPMLGPYSSSKAGVVFFSRGLAEEAREYGIHVAVGCPGNVKTAMLPEHVTPLMPPMDADQVARRLITQMDRGNRVIVFPLYARLWWWLDRASPDLLGVFRQIIVRRARARVPTALQ